MTDWQRNLDAAIKQRDQQQSDAIRRAAQAEPSIIPFLRDTALPAFNSVRDFLTQRGRSVDLISQLDDPRTAYIEMVVHDGQTEELTYRMSVDLANQVPTISVRHFGVPIATKWPATIGMRLDDITGDDVRDDLAGHYQRPISP